MRYYYIGYRAHPSYWWAEPPNNEEVWLDRFPDSQGVLLEYRIRGGRFPGDMIWSNIWSLRMLQAALACNANGFEPFDIKVAKGRKIIDGFKGIYVLGRGGHLDEKRSEVRRIGDTIISHKAVHMNEREWDKSDIFHIPELGRQIYVVERIAKGLAKLRLKNVNILCNEEMSSP